MVDMIIGSATKGGRSAVPKVFTAKLPEAVTEDEQVRRFVLLTFLMKGAGLCTPDIQLFLGKYLRTLTKAMYGQLRAHLPGVQDVKLKTWTPTFGGLASLGDMTLKAEHIQRTLEQAHLRLIEEPSWFDGTDGWFIKTAAKLSGYPVFKEDGTFSHNVERFWLPELENAVYIAAMARLQAAHTEDNAFLAAQAPTYREAWWALFGVFFSEKHFAEVCKCKGNKTLALGALDKYKGKFHFENEMHSYNIGLMEFHLRTVMEDFLGSGRASVRELYSSKLEEVRPLSEDVYTLHWGSDTFLDMLEAMHNGARTTVEEEELKGEVPVASPAAPAAPATPVASPATPAAPAGNTEVSSLTRAAKKNLKRRARRYANKPAAEANQEKI
ncbi:hypothetical protein B0T25DRAFT_562714 [Lasiosphaeria hispida]|uniref:Uncharacterized protein n=1 Tax=Lasiosphaeria hispida TaxID=260671 RepID=A0AAJ0HVT2_9PEZI|nr:hypothetical protein B0T25DRAFT_562714 [Lasiosphaeria hispida]